MKNLKKTFLFLLVIPFLSCSSDDDKPTFSTADLIGTWKTISTLENGIETIKEGDCDYITVITETTIKTREYYGSDCLRVAEDTSAYTLEGDVITETNGDYSYTSKILILNKTTLSMEGVYVEKDVTYKYITTYTKK